MGEALKVFIPITKVDAEKRIVYGVATAEKADRSGEICDYETTKPFYEKWSSDIAKASDGKSLGNLRAMHGKIAAGKVTSLAFNDAEKQIEIAAKVVDDNEWTKVLEGVYTGFSQGGAYVKRWTDPQNPELTRYTADPTEVSLVDLPCLPSATFEVVKADGSTEMRKFHSAEPAPAAREPSNEEIAAKAEEMAKAAGDGSAWVSHVEAARAELSKAAEGAAALAQSAEALDQVAAAAVEAAQAVEDMAKAMGEAGLAKGAEAAPEIAPVRQVWLAKDGAHFEKKADALAHNAQIDAEAAAKSAAAPAEAALAALEAKVGLGKAAEPAPEAPEAAPASREGLGKAKIVEALSKWVGEEAWDAARAIEALNTIFFLLGDELAEDENEPGQIASLKAAIEALKDFIASEIQEDSLEAAAKIESLEKRAAEGDALRKQIDEITPRLEALTKRVEELAAMPTPAPFMPGTIAVEKGRVEEAANTIDGLAAQLAKLTPEEASLLLIKAAQSRPQHILSRG